MAKLPKIKVLYFLAGHMATDEELSEIESFSARHNVCLRSAPFVSANEAVEPFDIVAGTVPPIYAAAAEAKGEFVEPETPKTPAASVSVGSPVAPAEPVEPPKAPETPDKPAAAPKAPAAKPGAAWKPNA